MLIGKYEVKISNNSIKIPKKMREALGNNVIITVEPENDCINIIPISNWNKYKEKLIEYTTDEKNRTLFSAYLTNIDDDGSLKVDKNLLNSIISEKECYILGFDNYIELWNKEKYIKYFESLNKEEIEDMLKRVGF